ncbi:MAG: phage tail spike protein, partial [Thermotogota bacterium]|nr:phage tail spike protein [Thermotogota bacterium]
FITTIVEGADDLSYQLDTETRREDESTLQEQVLSSYLLPRQIKLKGIVKGSDSADLIAKLGTLQTTLSAGIVSFEHEGGSISCYLDGGVSWKKIGPEFGTLIAECEISLREIGTADSSPAARTLKHYRGVTYQSTLKPISGHIRETFMGRKELELTLENQDIQNLDVIRVEDGVTIEYYVVQIPEPERRDNSQFITITAEHAYYGFGNRVFLDNSTQEEVFEYFGIDLSTLLGYLFDTSGVAKNTDNLDPATLSEMQEIGFSSQTRLNALQAICEKWGIEYKFSADGLTCYIGEKGSLGDTTGAMIEYSKNLKGIKKRIDTRGLVTRLRPVGSSENLPTWYVYQNLRITTLVPNGAGGYDHSGDLFIDKNTATYGIIERRMDFDVKVQAKHGTVTGTGTGAIEGYDGDYPYIVESARNEATDALNGGTLLVADGANVGQAKILYYDGTSKRIYYKIDSDENFDFTPSVGAFYKITDIELTYQEINEAAATLLSKAQDYLNTAAEPQVSYEVDFAQLWERDKISYSTDYFEVGDMITVKDTDLGINDSLRVISKEIDVVRPWNVKIEVSNKVQQIEDIILDIIEEGNTIKKKERVLTINQKRHNDAVRALQLLKNNNFFGGDVEINGSNIKAGTIEAEAIAIGSGNRNFQLWGVSFDANYEGLYNKFHATGGALVFYGEEDVWTLNTNTVSSLTDDTTYLIYVRLRKGVLDSADNAIILSSDMKEAEDATYYYYHIGFLEVGNSTTASFLATSYGWTIIHGSQIQTGTVYADYIRVGSPADTAIGLIDTKAQDALDAAAAAESDAAAAMAEVNEIISDSILKGGKEKSNLRKEWDSIAAEYTEIKSLATSYSLTGATEYTAFNNATVALWTYLNGGSGSFNIATVPLWVSDAQLGNDTSITASTFRSKFSDYYDTRQGILNKFVDYTKGLASAAQAAANAAQEDADAALAEVGEIVSDSILKGGKEKSQIRQEWDSIVLEYKKLLAQVTDFGLGSDANWTNYVSKTTLLWQYLNGGSGTFNIDTVPLWISDAQLGNDTSITASTFRSKFAAYYEGRQQLLNKFARFFAENVGSGYTEIDGGKITSFEILAEKYIQAGSDEENYRLTSTGLSFRRLIAARVNKLYASASSSAAYDRVIEIWYRFTANRSDASPDWSSWYHGGDSPYSSWFQWWIDSTEAIYGADLTDFAMQFKFVVHSTSSSKSNLDEWNVYINDELVLGLDSYAQWVNNKDASSSGITVNAGGYIEPTNYSSYGTYITKPSSIVVEYTPELDVSKVMHSIHQDEIYFDGSSGNMKQRIWHNKHIDPSRYNVILNEVYSEIQSSSFSSSTSYIRYTDITPYEDYFDIEFCAVQGLLVTEHDDVVVGELGDVGSWKTIATLSSATKIEFDIFHKGILNVFHSHISHEYSSAYTGTVKAMLSSLGGNLYISFDGDTTAEITITDTGGAVRAKNIKSWSSGTKIPLKGNFRYEIQLWK